MALQGTFEQLAFNHY